MATIPRLTVSEYNNVGRINDTEHAVYLLNCLEALAATLLGSEEQSGHLERMHQRYTDGVPQALCDQVGQVAEDILDRLRRVDPAQRVEYAAWDDATRQRYVDKMVMGREYHDFC